MVKQKRIIRVIVLVVILSAGGYFWGSISSGFNWIGSVVSYPFLSFYHYVVSRCLSSPYEKVRELEIRCNKLVEELTVCQGAQDYADDIKEIQQFKKRYNLNHAWIGQILARHLADDEHYFLVEGGTKAGCSQEMIALVHNHVVGRVVACYPYYSKVMLITDKRLKIAAYCAKTKAKGILCGTNELQRAELIFVDHLKRLEQGDKVFSSGQGLVFPRGFCLGEIDHFVKKGIEYEISIKPLIDFHLLNYCLLVHPYEIRH